nr:MAG TPA: hypothetical protein [Caudoviricetes sp.]
MNYYLQRIVIEHSCNKCVLYTRCSKIDNILNTVENILCNKESYKIHGKKS